MRRAQLHTALQAVTMVGRFEEELIDRHQITFWSVKPISDKTPYQSLTIKDYPLLGDLIIPSHVWACPKMYAPNAKWQFVTTSFFSQTSRGLYKSYSAGC